MVRVTMLWVPTRSLRRGKTWFCHISIISPGGPGMATSMLPLCSTHHPGAVPRGLGIARADGISIACFRFCSGMEMPRLRKCSLSSLSSSSCKRISSPSTLAIASRVRSSWVGPRPPVLRMTRERSRACLKAWERWSRSSPIWLVCRTCRPRRASWETR